ncbi:MAG: C1 family peptidase [Blastocatellia bacterium]
MNRFFLLLLLVCSASQFAFAQSVVEEKGTGLVINQEELDRMPRKLELSSVSYRGMPPAHSLLQYAPYAGDQGTYGTCMAWATAYSAASMIFAQTHGITDREKITKAAFSPTYLFQNIVTTNDNCQSGANPGKAIEAMLMLGVPFLRTVPYTCGKNWTNAADTEAKLYRALDVHLVFGTDKDPKDDSFKIETTKKALLENTPVIVGFDLPKSFFRVKGDLWNPDPSEATGGWQHGKHAMTVIGYDDRKEGGAFLLMNSWGRGWGNDGFVWVRYKDYNYFCMLAIQLFANPSSPVPEFIKDAPPSKPMPTPQPTPAPNAAFTLKGSVEFKLNTGEGMSASRISTRNLIVEDAVKKNAAGEDMVAYRMDKSYQSGTKFRFFINLSEQAYIYAFATDLTGKVNRILPFDDSLSTLVGARSVVAFPSDTKIVKMDDNKGTDYLLILYSTEKLDAKAIAERMSAESGGLSRKIRAALGTKLISKGDVQYDNNAIGFSYTSKTRGGIVPLMVEISHE